MDRSVQRALVARIVADNGVDGHTAAAMVADVQARAAESPHADVVAAAAHAIFDPIVEAFGRALAPVLASMVETFRQMWVAVEPAVKAWVEVSAGGRE